ncbi:MAG: CDP-alcohol phosphatidyltransferase family protein [Flavobacteriales bacterium]
MKKQIPNIITSLNLMCGSIAIIFILSGNLITASFFVFLGIFFDFFDGLAARLLNAQSEVGLQLDSLADIITSGLAPALVIVQLISLSITGDYLSVDSLFATPSWNSPLLNYTPFVGLLIAIASAYRLAKFNIDDRQTSSFIGLPTPANAILVLSLPLILHFQHNLLNETIILNKWFLILLTILSCVLLNAEIALFALKFKTWDFKSNVVRYIFIIFTIVSLLILHFLAIPLIILAYILFSLFWKNR